MSSSVASAVQASNSIHPFPGLITYFIPCYTAGKNAEGVGETCLTHGILFFVPFVNIYCGAVIRGKIREKKGIDVSCTARVSDYVYVLSFSGNILQ